MELINQIDETICFNKNNIRVIGSYNEPCFVAKDVCQILEIKDISMALTKISEKWKDNKVISTLGGKQDMRIISEAGLYKLIMRSNKQIAQKFQEVVCEFILPSLRKKGEYKLKTLLDEKNKDLEIEKHNSLYIDKHTRHNFSIIKRIIDNKNLEPMHKTYERLWAINNNMILWDDMPPDFCEKYNVPHRMDYGIDIISRDFSRTGQVKHYGNNSRITWKDISTFHQYSEYLEISKCNQSILTTPEAKIDKMVEAYATKFKIPIERESYQKLFENIKPYLVDEQQNIIESQIKIELRDYILQCYNILTEKDQKIFKFQLPCGVGKSFIIFYIIQETLKENKEEKFVIFVPWIQLAEQHKKILDKLKIKNQIIGNGNTKIDKTINVVICIYASAKHIVNEKDNFKYKFFDEAHHLESEFSKYRKVIDKIVCDKEIQFSATFKNQDNLDYIMTLREAIDKKYITDYKVVIEYFTNGNKVDSLIDLISKRPEWFPALIFFNSTKSAKIFTDKLKNKGVRSECVISETGSKKQNEIIEKIENNEIDVVCLVGCWNEGTSINNVRTVIMGDMRYSYINLIQIIMRPGRIHIDKPFYNIVIPIIKNDLSEDSDCYDDLSDFLKILHKTDPKIKESIKNHSNSSRIKIGIDCSYSSEEMSNEEFKAEHICEYIFDSLGNMLNESLTKDEKISEFMIHVKENNSIPSCKNKEIKFSDGIFMGQWFQYIKSKLTKESDIYKKLSEDDTIKNEMNRFLDEKEKKDDSIIILTKDEKISEFMIHAKENGIPSCKNKEIKFSDGTYMGSWFNDIKKKLTKESDIYKKLSEDKTIKNTMDRYLDEKEKKDDSIIILTKDEKISEFIIHVKENGIPSSGNNDIKFSDGIFMGSWFKNIKNKLTKESGVYKKLSEDEAIKNKMDRYLDKKDKSII